MARTEKYLAQPATAPSLSGETLVLFPQLPLFGVPRFSRVHISRLIKRGQFPPPVTVSERRRAWRLSDLELWKANLPVAATQPKPPSLAEAEARIAAEAKA